MKIQVRIAAILLMFTSVAFTACVLDAGVNGSTDEAIYKVTFDSESATVPATPVSKMVASPAETVDALPDAPVKNGSNFRGWYTGVNGGGTAFTETTKVTADITVYAKWTGNVTYNLNTGSGTTPTDATNYLPSATVVTASSYGLTKTGYTFTGWNKIGRSHV